MSTTREQHSLDQRWTAYQRLEKLTNHWYWRPGWNENRRFYTWHLTFDNQPDLHHLVTRIQQHLNQPGLDLVPLEGLHLTMQGVGFTDEVRPADLDAIRAATRRRCAALAPFDITLGPVDPDAEGVGLLVTPWAPVENVRRIARDAISEVWDDVPEPAEGFRPHVTVAYSGAPVPAAPVRSKLQDLRGLPPATVTVTAVSLIALTRRDRTYQWDTIDQVPLGSACEGDMTAR